jgi:hypothetical protein
MDSFGLPAGRERGIAHVITAEARVRHSHFAQPPGQSLFHRRVAM